MDITNVSAENLSEIARVHLAAFPDSAITLLGEEAARRYYHWLLAGPHDCLAVCAVDGQDLSGFLFGGTFRGAMTGFLKKTGAISFFGCFPARGWWPTRLCWTGLAWPTGCCGRGRPARLHLARTRSRNPFRFWRSRLTRAARRKGWAGY